MNVFISWSGSRSHAVAEILKGWVCDVIQAAKPWLSSADIDRGAMWMSTIGNQLHTSTVGIFCLTEENKNAPWILFEAGAVAKGVQENRICTLLIDLQPTDIAGPLGQFNHTMPDREGMFKLAATLNRALDPSVALTDTQLKRSFDAHWAEFEQQFRAALEQHPDAPQKKTPAKPDAVLAEILSTVRSLANRVAKMEVRGAEDSRYRSPSISAMKVTDAEREAYERLLSNTHQGSVPQSTIDSAINSMNTWGPPQGSVAREIARALTKNGKVDDDREKG